MRRTHLLNASLTAHCSTGGLEEGLPPASRRAQATPLLGALAAGSSAGSATARHRANASGQQVRRGNGRVRAPRAGSLRSSAFACKHKSPSSERFPTTAPHNPVRRRSAGSCAPIDHMLTTFGLLVFVKRRSRVLRRRTRQAALDKPRVHDGQWRFFLLKLESQKRLRIVPSKRSSP